MTSWYSVQTPEVQERLQGAWSGAPYEQEDLCGFLLDVARQQVMAYAADDDAADVQVYELLSGLGYDDSTITTVLTTLDLLGEDEEATDVEPPDRYVYAQLQQAKNLWNAGAVNSNGEMDQFSYVPRPLDKTIKAIIRPTTGAASVF